jgi:hypothetical protein
MQPSTRVLPLLLPCRCAPHVQQEIVLPKISPSAPHAPQEPTRVQVQPHAHPALLELPTGSLVSHAAPPYAHLAPTRRLARPHAPTAGQATLLVLLAPGRAVHAAPVSLSPVRPQVHARLALLAVLAELAPQLAHRAPHRQALVQASLRQPAQVRPHACSARLAQSRKTAASRAAASVQLASLASIVRLHAPTASTFRLAHPTA